MVDRRSGQFCTEQLHGELMATEGGAFERPGARRGERGWAVSARECGGPVGGRARVHAAAELMGTAVRTCLYWAGRIGVGTAEVCGKSKLASMGNLGCYPKKRYNWEYATPRFLET